DPQPRTRDSRRPDRRNGPRTRFAALHPERPTLPHDPRANRPQTVLTPGGVGVISFRRPCCSLRRRGDAVTGGRPPDELDAWVLETAPRALAYARSLLGDLDQAEDVVQDCYCRLLAKADVYDLPRDGLKLLFKAVGNACINRATR